MSPPRRSGPSRPSCVLAASISKGAYSDALEPAALGRNRHREERSDAAIQESRGALRSPGLLRFARNDAAGSTEMQYVLRTGNDSGSVPQAIENAENGLGNGKPSACVFSLGDLIMRVPYV